MTVRDTHLEASVVPEIETVTMAMAMAMLSEALRKGWKNFTDCPLYGMFFGGFYVVGGLLIYILTTMTGETYWVFIAGFGFPLIIGPFAAIGLCEISRTREKGERVKFVPLLAMAYRQRNRQLPSMIMDVLLIFMFWAFGDVVIFNHRDGYATFA